MKDKDKAAINTSANLSSSVCLSCQKSNFWRKSAVTFCNLVSKQLHEWLCFCVLLGKLLPYQNIFHSKMQARRKERKQINMYTKNGRHRNSSVQATLLKCSAGLHVHQKKNAARKSCATVNKPSPVTLHLNFGLPLLPGALYSQTTVTRTTQVGRW